MKSGLVLLLVFFSLLLVSGCKDAKTGIVIPETVGKYPTALNTEWEYETTTYLAKYDNFGNLSADTLYEPISYTTLKITSINDSINEEKNLVRFDYSSDQEYSSGIRWYRNSDSALERIAYSGNERDWVTPKIQKSNARVFLNSLSKNLFPDGIVFPNRDTAYISKFITLKYPLAVGSYWQFKVTPDWIVTKTIVGKKQMIFDGNNAECFDIRTLYSSIIGIDIHDYINYDFGLVKREIIFDSTAFTGPDSPDVLFWGKMKTTSNLIRKSK